MRKGDTVIVVSQLLKFGSLKIFFMNRIVGLAEFKYE